LGTITAFFTSLYSLRLLYLGFISSPRLHKTVANQIHESPAPITIVLTILSIGSIFLGYLTKDIFVGVGSPFLDHIMLILPRRNTLFLAEFLPFYIKNLPFFFSLLSVILVIGIYTLFRHYGIMYHPFFRDIHYFLSYK
jgi:NADH-ubiquinone oxidoreductase chain 5